MENRTFRADGACECVCGVVLCWAASPSPMRSNRRAVFWRFFLPLFSRALVLPPSCARPSWWVVEFPSPKCVSEKEIPVMGKTIAFQRNHFRDPTPPDAYQTVRIGRGNRGTPNRRSCTPDRIGRAACRCCCCCRSRKENRWWMVVLSRYQWRIVFLLASWKVLEWQFAAQRLCVPFRVYRLLRLVFALSLNLDNGQKVKANCKALSLVATFLLVIWGICGGRRCLFGSRQEGTLKSQPTLNWPKILRKWIFIIHRGWGWVVLSLGCFFSSLE